MHENFPAGTIITNGLGSDACRGFITTHFHLFCGITITVPNVSVGGSKPMAPGEIANFYQPVDYQPLNSGKEVPYEAGRSNNYVKIEISIKDKTYEKEFLVTPRGRKTVAEILNFVNVTKERISVKVTNLKRIAVRAVVTIRNLWRKP